MKPYSPLKVSTDVTEEHIAFNFRVEEFSKQTLQNHLFLLAFFYATIPATLTAYRNLL
jgi:hypothetical protein